LWPRHDIQIRKMNTCAKRFRHSGQRTIVCCGVWDAVQSDFVPVAATEEYPN